VRFRFHRRGHSPFATLPNGEKLRMIDAAVAGRDDGVQCGDCTEQFATIVEDLK